MIVGGILALLGAWFWLPTLDADPVGDCVVQALNEAGTRVAVSSQRYEDIKQHCEKASGR
jgi:hypothetical protein